MENRIFSVLFFPVSIHLTMSRFHEEPSAKHLASAGRADRPGFVNFQIFNDFISVGLICV